MGVISLIKDFTAYTSAHGLPQIGSARNWPVRAIWTLIFLGACVMFGYQMKVIFQTYFAYDVVVATLVTFGKRDFPAVTICNRNPYKASQVAMSSDMQKLMDDYTSSMLDGWVNYDIYKFNNQSDNLEKTSHALTTMVYIAKGWTDAAIISRSYSLAEIMHECTFDGQPCNLASDFVTMRDPNYGMCYQFNNVKPAKYEADKSGPDSGLRMILKSDQAEFLPITDTATFKIAIHAPLQEPFVDAFGYNAAAGYTNSLAIKVSGTQRLPFPYGDCTATKDGQTFFYLSEEYSMEGCFRSCYQQFIIDKCGCADPRFASPAGSPFLSCVTAIREAQLAGDEGAFDAQKMCTCPQRCDDTEYSVVAHQRWWPSLAYKPDECANEVDYVTHNASWMVVSDNTSDCRESWHENSLIVEVYYETLTKFQLTSSEAYTISDIILNFGGQIGLWLGFSVITFIEFFGLAILIAMACCAKVRGPGPITEADTHAKDIDEIDEIIDKAYANNGQKDEKGDDDDDTSDISDVDPYEGAEDEPGDVEPPKVV